jgi:alpha-beta hydrolase superfamily lysophospholipase
MAPAPTRLLLVAGGYHLWGQSFGGLLAVLVALDATKGAITSCVLTSPAMANELDCALNFVKVRGLNAKLTGHERDRYSAKCQHGTVTYK